MNWLLLISKYFVISFIIYCYGNWFMNFFGWIFSRFVYLYNFMKFSHLFLRSLYCWKFVVFLSLTLRIQKRHIFRNVFIEQLRKTFLLSFSLSLLPHYLQIVLIFLGSTSFSMIETPTSIKLFFIARGIRRLRVTKTSLFAVWLIMLKFSRVFTFG